MSGVVEIDPFEDMSSGFLFGMDRVADEIALRAIFGPNINVDAILRDPDEARLALPFDNEDAGLADNEYEDAIGLVYLAPSDILRIRRGGDHRYWLPRGKPYLPPLAKELPAMGWYTKDGASERGSDLGGSEDEHTGSAEANFFEGAQFYLYQIEQRAKRADEREEDYKATYSVPKLGLDDIHCDTEKQRRLMNMLRNRMSLQVIATEEGVRPEAIMRRFQRIVERSRLKKRAVKAFAEGWSHDEIAEHMDLPRGDIVAFVGYPQAGCSPAADAKTDAEIEAEAFDEADAERKAIREAEAEDEARIRVMLERAPRGG